MKTEEEFDLFYIDMNNIEQQVAEHSFLYVQYCKDLKDANSDLKQAKANLDLIEAETSLLIGRNPAKYKLSEKPTAKAIANTVLTREPYKKALEEFRAIQDKVSTLQIYVNAFDHRKRMLTQATELHRQQYFSTPYVASSDMKVVVEQLEKKAARTKKKKR